MFDQRMCGSFSPKMCECFNRNHCSFKGVYYETHWEEWIKKTTHPVYVLDPLACHSIWDIQKNNAYILVCGSEGRGIQSKLIKSVSISPLCIPMQDGIDSLNAGICVSIALNHLNRSVK